MLEDSGLAHCTGWRYSQILQLVKETGLLLNDFAMKNRSEKFTADMEGLTENCIKAVETLSLENISAAVRAAVDYLSSSHTDYAPDTTRHLVRQAVAYVDKNYFEDRRFTMITPVYFHRKILNGFATTNRADIFICFYVT